ncbi:uncharacterized protein BDW47DRAFT_115523 [Aspergillus candidus]|uniref:Rhodopsin domain-containing protein n=1 Tax=Aspergillus candidus TaxID=41067 RepID=A0A2I2FL88_ASPCN|nr:hypothetical protein BDW47DRAFT_115523 [Aspergillus candidus]PLB41380.1 hypothetical protein BDW47DRAFT_115523 [Aspergillus candidus]
MVEPPNTAYGNKGSMVLGISWAETALALVLVALRAKTAAFCLPGHPRAGILGLRWDFIWVIIALGLALCSQSLMTASVHYDLINHSEPPVHGYLVQSKLWSWMGQITSLLAMAVARIAVVALLLTLQSGTACRGRTALYLMAAFQLIISLVLVVLMLAQCQPMAKLWDNDLDGACPLIVMCSRFGYFHGVTVLLDLILAFYPLYIIGRLQQMKRSTKVSLCLIMCGGLISGIAGLNKTVSITQNTELIGTGTTSKVNVWALTEMWFIIIFGSIPVLRACFVRFTQDIKKTAARSSGASSDPSDPDGSWVELHNRSQSVWVTRGPTHATEGCPVRQILVTTNTSVVREGK